MRYLILAAALSSVPVVVQAGTIERACLTSGRPAASTTLCACIQQAADLTLTNRDQSRAAKFFRDPHQAQEVRQSDRQTDEEFWLRYRSFGDTAEAFCSG